MEQLILLVLSPKLPRIHPLLTTSTLANMAQGTIISLKIINGLSVPCLLSLVCFNKGAGWICESISQIMSLPYSSHRVKTKIFTITSKTLQDHSLLTSFLISCPTVLPFIQLQPHWLSCSPSKRMDKFLPQSPCLVAPYWKSLSSQTSTCVAPSHPRIYTQIIIWRIKCFPGHPS